MTTTEQITATAKRILVTGGAGFIGSSLVEDLVKEGHYVIVVDNFDPFYAREIKQDNIKAFIDHPSVHFVEGDVRDPRLYEQLTDTPIDVIVHLAAKAGVRPSIADPIGYQEVNVSGTQALLEFARGKKIRQFIFASSSSVYGINKNIPWSEEDHVLQPISPYASSKVSGELLGHVYSHLFGIRFIALRFFTVYGPKQRPDLAIHKFALAILQDRPVTLFGEGNTKRDYTYIDDIVAGVKAAISYDKTMYEVINLGNNHVISLSEMVRTLEDCFGKKAIIERLREQPGDVPVTNASVEKANRLLNYQPATNFTEGVAKFSEWLNQKNT